MLSMAMLPRHRVVQWIAAAALASTVLVVTPKPTTAVSGVLAYDCTSASHPSLGTQPFFAEFDTGLPAQVPVGQPVDIFVTAVVTVPSDVVAFIGSTGAVTVDGTAADYMTINGGDRAVSLTIAPTPWPAGGSAQVTAAGSAGPLTAQSPGVVFVFDSGPAFSIQLTGRQANGSETVSVGFGCILQAGQNQFMDSVVSVLMPTTTTLTVQPLPLRYGAHPVVLAEVAISGSTLKPDGVVQFAFSGKTVNATVEAGKATATMPRALTLGPQPITAVFTPTYPWLPGSQAALSLNVLKDETTTSTSARYRAARDRLAAKAAVVADYNARVRGEVKFVLKRNGVKIRAVKVELNEFAKAKKVFGHISRAGRYAVVARYLGSTTHLRSRDQAKVVV